MIELDVLYSAQTIQSGAFFTKGWNVITTCITIPITATGRMHANLEMLTSWWKIGFQQHYSSYRTPLACNYWPIFLRMI